MRRFPRASAPHILVFLLAACVPSTGLGQATWNGTIDGNWSVQGNWSGTSAANLVNGGTSTLVFAGSNLLSTTNALVNFQASGISFDSTAGNFTLAGNAIRNSANVANNAANSHQTIGLDINVTASGRQYAGVVSATTTYAGKLSGAGGMSFRTTSGSTSVHILSGSNSYAASTGITTAIVVVDHLKALSSGTIEFGGSGTLRSNLDLTGVNRLTNSAVTFTSANNRAQFAGANSIEFAAALRSNNNATVSNDLDVGRSVTFGGLTVFTANAATSGTVTVTGPARTVIAGNAVDGSGIVLAISKTGAGSLVLAGTNTYSGGTAVLAGSLFVNGDSAAAGAAVTVSGTAVLGGEGTIGGLTTLSGTLVPGADFDDVGLLTFASPLALNASSRTVLEVAGSGRGAGYDAVDVSGVTFGGTLELSFPSPVAGTFNLFGTGGALSKSGNFAAVVSGGAFGSPTWALSGEVWTATSGASTLSFDQASGTLVIVPEPPGVALAGVGVCVVGWIASRRFIRSRRFSARAAS